MNLLEIIKLPDWRPSQGARQRASRHRSKLIALAFWGAVLVAYFGSTVSQGLSSLDVLRSFSGFMQVAFIGPVVFVLFYILQPLIFFPSWLLTVLAGYLYGPIVGSIYVLLASNLSALVAYGIGRFFGMGLIEGEQSHALMRKYAVRMRSHSLETVLAMRFLFLPYDLVSYASGFLRIRLRPFILATIVGSIPGTFAFVLFGSSMEGEFVGAEVALDWITLGASAGLMLVSLILWRIFARRSAM